MVTDGGIQENLNPAIMDVNNSLENDQRKSINFLWSLIYMRHEINSIYVKEFQNYLINHSQTGIT